MKVLATIIIVGLLLLEAMKQTRLARLEYREAQTRSSLTQLYRLHEENQKDVWIKAGGLSEE